MSILSRCFSLVYEIYCDGASRSNPGEASVGISILKDSEEIATIKKRIGIATNNVAEYLGLIEALKPQHLDYWVLGSRPLWKVW